MGHTETREAILSHLGETNPLRLSKLSSIFGSFERIPGLNTAARIDGFKVCRRTKNPLALTAGECQILQRIPGL